MKTRVCGNGARHVTFHILWTKTTAFVSANVTATCNGETTSAVTVLDHHIQANAKVPGDAPLFAFKTTTGWSPMTKDFFMGRCNQVWSVAGLEPMLWHCFRIGGTTELLLRGVAPDIVQAQGRWVSQAFMLYWRRVDAILPLFLTNSFNASRVSLVKKSMSAYQQSLRTTST